MVTFLLEDGDFVITNIGNVVISPDSDLVCFKTMVNGYAFVRSSAVVNVNYGA